MKQRLYLDMDEVLADTLDYMCSVFNFENPYLKEENLGVRSLHELLKKDWRDVWMNLGVDFWANIPPYYWAQDLINYCETLCPNEVYFLTSPVPDGCCASGKQLWVNKNFPKYTGKLIIAHAKYAVVDQYSVLVDDSEHNERKFLDNHKIYNFVLFPSFSNRMHPMRKLPDWFEKTLAEIKWSIEYNVYKPSCP